MFWFGKKNKKKNVRPAAAGQSGARPAGPPPAFVRCVKCGATVPNDGRAHRMGDRYYCGDCYGMMKDKLAALRAVRGAQTSAPPPANPRSPAGSSVSARCCECGAPVPYNGVARRTGGKYYCGSCYVRRKYPGVLSDGGTGAEELRRILLCDLRLLYRKRAAAQAYEEEERRRKESLYRRACSTCGTAGPERAFVLVDDLFYCEACYHRRFPPAVSRAGNAKADPGA